MIPAVAIRNDYLPYPPRAISPVHLRTNGRAPPFPFKYAPHPIPPPPSLPQHAPLAAILSFRLFTPTASAPLRSERG
ncbi:unnamed protein product [Urochloa humidicola]